MKFNKHMSYLTFLFLSSLLLFGCSYSFTGASVPAHLNTIKIPIAVDRSNSGVANLSENFTNELNLKFLNDNSLQVTDRANSDAILECTITGLPEAFVDITADERIASRKITMNVKVTYKDLVKRKTIFERTFSNYKNYPNEGDIITARENAVNELIDLISEDILLAVVSNW